ncbi:MAG TPA: serine hydrolase [Longimicrobiales bacterium]|nr:serine hydrolase [Longimicrobiales bacterium]
MRLVGLRRSRRLHVMLLHALVAALMVLPSSVAAQAAPLGGLDSYIESAMRDWSVPGLAIAVVRNDSIIHARGYGVRELGRPDRVDEHTLFAIASTTKAMTTAALGMLVDEDSLDWDDRVVEHLPSFELSDAYLTHNLTVRDLITHRAGISRSDNLWIAGPFDRAEVLRRARYLEPVNGFRSQYGYHNVMYTTAGEVVAAAAGMSWDDFIEQRLFRPLGMDRSTTRAAVVATRDNVSAPHTWDDDRVIAGQLRNYDNLGGAGSAFSSVHDMAQWIRLHLNEGVYEGQRLLSEATMRELHEPQVVIHADTTSERMYPGTNLRAYALGWQVQDYHGHELVHHSGSLNWTRTHVMMVPEEDIGVVVIANLGSSNLQQGIAFRVIDALLGLPQRDWSAELLALAQRGEKRSEARAKEVEESRVPDTRPSLALDGYTGTYRSELYGDVRLRMENGHLVLDYAPDYVADLEHWHHDTFRAVWRRAGFGRDFVTFSLDRDAEAAELELSGFGEFERVEAEPAAP